MTTAGQIKGESGPSDPDSVSAAQRARQRVNSAVARRQNRARDMHLYRGVGKQRPQEHQSILRGRNKNEYSRVRPRA